MTALVIYLDYSDKSHVLVKRPSDDFRVALKDALLVSYHPRLYPIGPNQPEKGWLIPKCNLTRVEELAKEMGVALTIEKSTRPITGLPKREKKVFAPPIQEPPKIASDPILVSPETNTPKVTFGMVEDSRSESYSDESSEEMDDRRADPTFKCSIRS